MNTKQRIMKAALTLFSEKGTMPYMSEILPKLSESKLHRYISITKVNRIFLMQFLRK